MSTSIQGRVLFDTHTTQPMTSDIINYFNEELGETKYNHTIMNCTHYFKEPRKWSIKALEDVLFNGISKDNLLKAASKYLDNVHLNIYLVIVPNWSGYQIRITNQYYHETINGFEIVAKREKV